MIVRDVLDADPPVGSPDEAASVAWERLRAAGANHLIVVRDGEVAGVVSTHDLGGPAGGVHRRMGRRVADLMHQPIVTIAPSANVRRAAALMREHRIGCLPVIERGRLVGVVTAARLLGLLEELLAPDSPTTSGARRARRRTRPAVRPA